MNRKNSEEKVRISRILQIDEAIRSGRYPNAPSLAEKLEVTSRTILRDIEYLRDFYQAPIEYDFTRKGFYYTEPNFFIKSIMLTEGELWSLAIFDQLLTQYCNTPLEENLRAVFEKVKSSLPENITYNSAFLPEHTTFIPDPPVIIDREVFESIFTALKTRQTIVFDYCPMNKTSFIKRTVDPYHAICQRNYWYILGHCFEKLKIIKIYSLSRIKKPRLTGKYFTVPPDFKAEDHFDREMGVFASDKKPYTFEFLIDKDVRFYALERRFHHTQIIKENDDGSVYVSFTTTQINEVLRWVLGQGHTVTVLNPPELVEMVKQETALMGEKYK